MTYSDLQVKHTCKTLEEQGLWDTAKCCKECHSNQQTMCLGMDTYRWIHGEEAELCCKSYWHFYGGPHDPYVTTVSTYHIDNGGIEISELDETT